MFIATEQHFLITGGGMVGQMNPGNMGSINLNVQGKGKKKNFINQILFDFFDFTPNNLFDRLM